MRCGRGEGWLCSGRECDVGGDDTLVVLETDVMWWCWRVKSDGVGEGCGGWCRRLVVLEVREEWQCWRLEDIFGGY